MDRSIWPGVGALLATFAFATLSACAPGTGEALSESAWFPPEKTAADFPGIAYPDHEGALTPPSGKVWLIGIDGATWDLIHPAIERGELPTFARLVDEGAWGMLMSEEPSLSPALWATVSTGTPRHVHGIVNFVEPMERSRATRPAGPWDRGPRTGRRNHDRQPDEEGG